jgi:hypothetical protein
MTTVTGAPIAPPYPKDIKEKRAAAIEPRRPLIHDVDDALENLGCQIERLAALYESNTTDFNELVLDTHRELSSRLRKRYQALIHSNDPHKMAVGFFLFGVSEAARGGKIV